MKHHIILELGPEDLESLFALKSENPLQRPLIDYIINTAIAQFSIQRPAPDGVRHHSTTAYVRGCLSAFPSHTVTHINRRPVGFTVHQDGTVELHQ